MRLRMYKVLLSTYAEGLWVSQNIHWISQVSHSHLFSSCVSHSLDFLARLTWKFSWSTHLFVCLYKWLLNVLEPECLELAFKTLWSLSLVIEEVQMCRARKEKHYFCLLAKSCIYHSHPFSYLTIYYFFYSVWQMNNEITCITTLFLTLLFTCRLNSYLKCHKFFQSMSIEMFLKHFLSLFVGRKEFLCNKKNKVN